MTYLYRPGIEGCSDHNCIFQDNSRGMHTNGGCRCEKDLLRQSQGRNAASTIRYLRYQLKKSSEKCDVYEALFYKIHVLSISMRHDEIEEAIELIKEWSRAHEPLYYTNDEEDEQRVEKVFNKIKEYVNK